MNPIFACIITFLNLLSGNIATANLRASKYFILQTPAKQEYRKIKCRVLDADGRPTSATVRFWYRIGRRVSDIRPWTVSAKGRTISVPTSGMGTAWFSADAGNQFSELKVRPRHGHVTLRLHRVKLASISGFVRDSAGRPIPAKVTLSSQSPDVAIIRDRWGQDVNISITDLHGHFVFKAIYPGIAAFVMVQSGGCVDFQSKAFRVKTGQSLTIPTITLQKGHVISGQVVDQHGKPVFDAVVRFEKASRVEEVSQRTDMDGKFLCDRLPKGRYNISISKGSKITRLTGETDTNAIYKLCL